MQHPAPQPEAGGNRPVAWAVVRTQRAPEQRRGPTRPRGALRQPGTFEFLVDAEQGSDNATFAFIEANARLQVEHTVTEEVTGVDLVKAQLRLAGGSSLADLRLTQERIPEPRGFAMQVRINMETIASDGTPRPSGGTLSAFEVPSGPGLRTDTFGYVGYTTSPSFDSLLAKLIGSSPSSDFSDVVTRTYRALCEFKIEGVATNIPFLQSLLRHPAFVKNQIYTRFVEDHSAELVQADHHQRFFFHADRAQSETPTLAGVKVDSVDPLAVLEHGKSAGPTSAVATAPVGQAPAVEVSGPDGTVPVPAPLQGTIVSLDVSEGDEVHVGQQLLIMESMKMEHVISAETSGIIRQLTVGQGGRGF